MIISPPFLPTPNVEDDLFVTAAMPDAIDKAPGSGGAPLGSYPLTTSMTWHNGLHITAPRAVNRALPVRAIADGTVIFKREPVPANKKPNDPQNYNPYGIEPAWTDNGIVIVRHTTEIGATGTAGTAVTYFSVYMHLSSVGAAVAENKPIWRKDAIGESGQILGSPNQIHFEICLDPTNLKNLMGTARATSWIDPETVPTADGRTDSVFGSSYVYLPAGTPTRTTAPTNHLQTGGATAGTGHSVANTLNQAQWVEVRYDRGSATLSSYRATSSTALNKEVGDLIGNSNLEPNGEYGLYNEANTRHTQAVAAGATTSPSGWYELLRFGRNIGTDPLPANAAHWRKIPTDVGTVWADLNAPGTRKFSDADFPAFKGWNCFDDDPTPDNQRCDSIELKRLIRDHEAPESIRERDALARRLGEGKVRAKLKRAIGKFPNEWDKTTISRRYDWLRVDEEFKIEGDTEWNEFKAHAESISFVGLPEEYKKATWHIHPRTFISHMRQCGWLSASELTQMVPKHALRTGKDRNSGAVGAMWEAISDVFANAERNPVLVDHRIPLNRMMRKYGINTPLRQASFLGNAIQETGWLGTLAEGSGSGYWYAPWYGRGFLQLTHASNYIAYWEWRGQLLPVALKTTLVKAQATEQAKTPVLRNLTAMQDANFPALTQGMVNWRSAVEARTALSTDPDRFLFPSDSAGFYWASLRMAQYADRAHTLERITVSTANGQGAKVYYRSPAFWEASAAVNLPGSIGSLYSKTLNGFDSRCCAYGYALAILTEMKFPNASNVLDLDFPEGYLPRRAR